MSVNRFAFNINRMIIRLSPSWQRRHLTAFVRVRVRTEAIIWIEGGKRMAKTLKEIREFMGNGYAYTK